MLIILLLLTLQEYVFSPIMIKHCVSYIKQVYNSLFACLYGCLLF